MPTTRPTSLWPDTETSSSGSGEIVTQNGVIETSTGDLLRAGFCDFQNDGSFDSATQSYRTDVPVPALARGHVGETQMHRWNGSAWVEVAQP
jgi:hypothetical protein